MRTLAIRQYFKGSSLLLLFAGSFEVTVDQQVAFSKLERGKFPDFQETVEVVRKAEETGKVATVEATQASCTIL